MRKHPVWRELFLEALRPHWPWMALGMVMGTAAALSGIGLLALSGWFISAAAVAGLTPVAAKLFNFFLPSIGVRLFAMTRTGTRYVERVVTHDATFRILESLRIACYRRIEPLAPAGLMRHRSGDLLNRVVADIDALDNLYARVLAPTVIAAASSAAVAVLIGIFTLTGAALLVAALLVAGAGVPTWAGVRGFSVGRRIATETAAIRRRVVDGVHGLSELLVFDGFDRYAAGCMESHHRLVQAQRRMHHIGGMASALVIVINGLAVIGVFMAGAVVVRDRLWGGEMIALMILAVMAAFEPVQPLCAAFQYLGQTREAARRLADLMSTRPAVMFPEKSAGSPSPEAGICIRGLFFHYDRQGPPALDGIDLAVAPGERLAIVGETGSGKTTLFHLLVRFWDPTRGEILIGGLRLPDISEDALRRHICVVSQTSHLFTATIRENLLLARPGASDDDLWHALTVARLDDFVRSLPGGLDTWVGVSGGLLSGGQARRVAVARGVLKDAPIWLLDEPTEGLDAENERRLIEAVQAAAAGKTLVMITHRRAGLPEMDRIIVLDGGRIVESGSHAALLAAGGRYAALFSLP